MMTPPGRKIASAARRALHVHALLIPALIIHALLTCPLARAQETPAPAAPSAAPEPPPDHVGFALPRVSEGGGRALGLADRAIEAKNWSEAAAILNDALGPPRKKDGPAIDPEGAPLVTEDGLRYSSLSRAVSRRIANLPEAGLAAWRERRGADATASGAAAGEAERKPAPPGGASVDWTCVLGRHDHASLALAPEAEARPGAYARWIHRLTNFRKLESSQPARNVYYTVYPMQVVSLGDLIFARSHQDVIALDRASGELRWRVDSDLPTGSQTHQSGSGIDSYRFFTDLGGWSLTVVPGERTRLVMLSNPGRGSVRENKLEFVKNRLIALDAKSGTVEWKRGGPEDPEASLRELTFAAAPSLAAGDRGDVLVVPATSGDGYHAAGFAPEGKLLWLVKLYSYIPEKFEVIDETLAHGASLASDGATVVGAPGHGFIFGVSASGETLWLRRYPVRTSGYPADPRWAPGHPIIAGGKAIAAPFDGESLLVLDAETGDLAWQRRQPGGYHTLLGADSARVYEIAANGTVTASSLADGGVVWSSQPLGRNTGRGIVTANRIYLAVDRGVTALDPAKGSILARFTIWDERLDTPAPGNLFLAGGDLVFMADWGLGCVEPYEATWKTLDALGPREQLLRRSRLLRAEEKYGESLIELRKALASTSDAAQADRLRKELVEVSQDAARTTKDPEFLRRALDEPGLIPSPAHRTAFLLKSAEIIRGDAPEAAAKMYRELTAGETSTDLVLTPEGLLADVAAYASDCLRELVASGKAEPSPDEEDRVRAAVEEAIAQGSGERLSRIASRQAHVLASARASAALARRAEEEGAFLAAAAHIERLLADHPHLAAEPDLREYLAGLRRRARPGRSGPAFDLEPAWKLRFEQPGAGSELVSMAETSDALPGVFLLYQGSLCILDDAGNIPRKLEVPGLPNLALAHSKVTTVLVEPALAHARDGRLLLFTGAGLHEVIGLLPAAASDGAAGQEPRIRAWHSTEHPLLKYLGEGEPAEAQARKKSTKQATTINDNQNFYARVEFDGEGNASIVEPGGTVILFERRTGRLLYRSQGEGRTSAGAPHRTEGFIAVETSKPPGAALHDVRHRAVVSLQTPATPWKVHVVPELAAVLDTASGVQVRDLASRPPPEGDPVPPATLWRDPTARGSPSVAWIDSDQVIAVEAGGRLVSRSLRSGRVRWSSPFPDGFIPLRTLEVDAPDGLPGDLVIASSRGVDPEDGRGVLGQRVAQDLHLSRIGRDGVKRWDVEVAKGGVAFDGVFVPARRSGSAVWLTAFNQKANAWKTRVVTIDIEKGEVKDLFEFGLVEKPNYPPPRWCLAAGGIAIGNIGHLAFFAPGTPEAAPGAPAEAAPPPPEGRAESGRREP